MPPKRTIIQRKTKGVRRSRSVATVNSRTNVSTSPSQMRNERSVMQQISMNGSPPQTTADEAVKPTPPPQPKKITPVQPATQLQPPQTPPPQPQQHPQHQQLHPQPQLHPHPQQLAQPAIVAVHQTPMAQQAPPVVVPAATTPPPPPPAATPPQHPPQHPPQQPPQAHPQPLAMPSPQPHVPNQNQNVVHTPQRQGSLRTVCDGSETPATGAPPAQRMAPQPVPRGAGRYAPVPTVVPAENREKCEGSKEDGKGGLKMSWEKEEKTDAAPQGDEQKPGERRADFVTSWIGKVLENGVEGLVKEYKDIPNESPPEKYTVSKLNPTKNRFNNIPCCDQTRFMFRDDPTFYIHANYVGSGEIKNRFICTQAPTPTTIIDFWKMVVASRVEYIVMLCDLKENGKVKSADYFPVKAGEIVTVGQFYMITKQDTVDIENGITMSTFRIVKNDGDDQPIFVKHVHWKTWPDHGVPTNYLTAFKIIAFCRRSVAPIVIHCSAGVGRTGTFVLIATIYENLRSPNFVGAAALLAKMRTERFKSIQGEVQYLYVHRCFVEYLTAKKYAINKAHAAKFRADYDLAASKPPTMI